MKQLVALAGALVLVVAAVLARNALTDGDDGGGGDSGGDARVVCITELADACQRLDAEVTIEDAATTIGHLADYDAWITLDPWPAIAEFDAPAVPVPPGEAIASTSLAFVIPDDATSCQEWRCLGEEGATVGMPEPTTAVGLLLLGDAARSYFGNAEFGTQDFEFDPGFATWFSQLTAHTTSDPLGDLLRAFPPTVVFDAVGTTRAEVETRVAPSRAAGRIDVAAPDPPAAVAVVVVPIGGSSPIDAAPLQEALVADGWEPGGETTNLPNPGVLYALLQL